MRMLILCLCAALFLYASVAKSDKWPLPSVKFPVSSDGQYLAKIKPGTSVGDTVGFSGFAKGAFATAIIYKYDFGSDSYQKVSDFSLKNPVAPMDVLISRYGRVVTIDNWHNLGYGKVLVIYDVTGKVLVEKELSDFYSVDKLEKIPQTVSSKWWRCYSPALSEDEQSVEIVDFMQRTITISMRDGGVKINSENEKATDCAF